MSGINSPSPNKNFNDFMGANVNIAGKEVKVGDVIKYTGQGSFGAVGQFCSRLVVSLKLGAVVDNKKMQDIGQQVATKFEEKLAHNMDKAVLEAKGNLDGKTLKKLESAQKKFIEVKGEGVDLKVDVSAIKDARQEVKAVKSLIGDLGKISPDVFLKEDGPIRAAFYESVSKGKEALTPDNLGEKYKTFINKELGPLLLKNNLDMGECITDGHTLNEKQHLKSVDSLGFQINLGDVSDLKELIANANSEMKLITNEQAKMDFAKLESTHPLDIQKDNEPLFNHMSAWADKSQKGDIFSYTANVAELKKSVSKDGNDFKGELKSTYNTYLKESSGSVFDKAESSKTLNIMSDTSFRIAGKSMTVGEARGQIEGMLQPGADADPEKAIQILEGVISAAIDDTEQVYRSLLKEYESSLGKG